MNFIPSTLHQIKLNITLMPPGVHSEAAMWLEQIEEGWADAQVMPTCYIVDGSWVSEHFSLPSDADIVFVSGDVSCSDYFDDRGPNDYTLVFITGSLRTRALIACSTTIIGGDVHCYQCYASSGNFGQLLIGGNFLTDTVLVEDGQNIVCGATLTASVILSYHNEVQAKTFAVDRFEKQPDLSLEEQIFMPDLLETAQIEEWTGSRLLQTGVFYKRLRADLLIDAMIRGASIMR
jgi:hypothetical protein